MTRKMLNLWTMKIDEENSLFFKLFTSVWIEVNSRPVLSDKDLGKAAVSDDGNVAFKCSLLSQTGNMHDSVTSRAQCVR